MESLTKTLENALATPLPPGSVHNIAITTTDLLLLLYAIRALKHLRAALAQIW